MKPLSQELAYTVEVREFYSSLGLWPERPRAVNPRGWLSNFKDPDDLAIAGALLSSLLIINQKQLRKMVASGFHSLSTSEWDPFSLSHDDLQAEWSNFRHNVIVTYPSGLDDPGASGHAYARAARHLVASQDQVCSPRWLVERLTASQERRDVVFVDDFAGTGDQFLGTWSRAIPTADGQSLESLSTQGKIARVWYIPAICTAHAKRAILRAAPIVTVRSPHVLPDSYCAVSPNTRLVPDAMRSRLHDFLQRYAEAAGYSALEPYGYGRLGLAISFEDATPDNTLPIFNGGINRPNTWIPLRKHS